MSNVRFAMLAVALFAITFAGMTWAMPWATKSRPVMHAETLAPVAPVAAPVQAVAPEPEARVPTFEQSVQRGLRKDWETSKTAHGDGDPKREALRLAALQAANAFALSPCDPTMKKNLVETLSAYAAAWSEMAGCKAGACGGGDRKLDSAAAAFSTPADIRVRTALHAAFDKGGISRQDFPAGIRLWVTMLVGDPGDPVSACAAGRHAEANR